MRTAGAWLAISLAASGAMIWQLQPSGTSERLRAVSAVSDKVAWASGNAGTVLRTEDGGAHWAVLPVPGADSLDFRDIEATSERTAYVLSVGSGDKSRIYKTTDAGNTWVPKFTNADPKAFYDAIAFSDAVHGIVGGGDYRKERDPNDNVAFTGDGGRTWTAPGGVTLRSFRSGVVFIPGSHGREIVAVGPAGTDRSLDGGRTWSPLGDIGFHAIGVDRSGKAVRAVGEQGRVGRMVGR